MTTPGSRDQYLNDRVGQDETRRRHRNAAVARPAPRIRRSQSELTNIQTARAQEGIDSGAYAQQAASHSRRMYAEAQRESYLAAAAANSGMNPASTAQPQAAVGGGAFPGGGGGGGGGLDLSAYQGAETALKDQNVGAEHEIATALADYLRRVGTNRDQYTQQSGQIDQRMQQDQAASQAQNQSLGQPILTDLAAQGVDPANVQALVQGNADTLNTQGSLQDQYLARQDQLMQGSYQDAQNAGALVNQSAQGERTNNYNALLAQLQQQQAEAKATYAAQNSTSGLGGYSGTSGGYRTQKVSGLDRANDWVSQNFGDGPRTSYAWKQLVAIGGGTPAGIMSAYNSKTPEEWAAIGLPNMGDLVTGALGELVQGDTESQVPITAGQNMVSLPGVGGSGQVNEGIAPMVQDLIAAVPGLRISSGYRDPQRNSAAGGAEHSNHLSGMAVDVVSDRAGYEQAAEWARANGAREVLFEGDHLHIAW